MRILLLIILSSFIFPTITFSQSNNLIKLFEEMDQNIHSNYKKIITVVNRTSELSFQKDKIVDYKNQYKKLEVLLTESSQYINSINKNTAFEKLSYKDKEILLYYQSDKKKDSYKVYTAINQAHRLQIVFMELADMVGENKLIDNEKDLKLIMDIYLKFNGLTVYYDKYIEATSGLSAQFDYQKEQEPDELTCETLKTEYLEYCNTLDMNFKNDYIKVKDSVVHNYFLLPLKYQSIKIEPEIIKVEDDVSSDTKEEKDKKLQQRMKNAINNIGSHEIFFEFKGHYTNTEDYTYNSYYTYPKYPADFTKKIRFKIAEEMKIKCN